MLTLIQKKIGTISIIIIIILILGGLTYYGYQKLFEKPCAKITEQRYPQFQNVCGPISCTAPKKIQPVYDENNKIIKLTCCYGYICNNKNSKNYQKCIEKNYCNFTQDPGLKFSSDQSNCDCDVSCNDPALQAFPSKVNMIPDDQNPGSLMPDSEIDCGIECKYAGKGTMPYTGDGGNGWCGKDMLCGYGPQYYGIYKPDFYGCFPSTTYVKCSKKFPDLVCSKTSGCDENSGYCRT